METKYLRMIGAMGSKRKKGPRDWSVYVVCCADGSFYTGTAKDVTARIEKHNAGKGAAYTRTHRPVRLLYQEGGLTRSAALIREAYIKTLPREKKERLTNSLMKNHPRKPGVTGWGAIAEDGDDGEARRAARRRWGAPDRQDPDQNVDKGFSAAC